MWVGMGVGPFTIPASVKTVVSTLSAGVLALRPFTILRSRMVIGFESDQVAASERPNGTYARIVVTETAAGIGATAVPDPSSTDGDPDAEWYLVQECMQSFLLGDGTGFIANAMVQYIIDNKSMRKVGPQDNVVAIYSDTGAVGAIITTRGRQLLQLH